MSESLPLLKDILEFSRESLPALSDSFNICFDTQFQLKPMPPSSWEAGHSAAKLSGTAGLCVVFKPGEAGGFLLVISEKMPLPNWYREPDETEESRLQTLAMEWTYGMLPEDFQGGEYATIPSSDLAITIDRSGISDGTEILELQLVDEQGEQASEASLWLIGPLETVSLKSEEQVEAIDEALNGGEEKKMNVEETPFEQEYQEANVAMESGNQPDAADMIERVRRLMPMMVEVSVRLAEKKINLSQLQTLSPGTLISFPKSCDDLLDMYVNNSLYAQGEAVKIGENFGLKINEVGTVIERPPGVFTL